MSEILANSSADTEEKFPAIDYSARDFPQIKQALIEFIKARFPDDFTDFTESNLSVILLELVAWVGDMLSYTIDVAANECFLPTIKQRQNAVNMVKLIGFDPGTTTAASVELLVDAGAVLTEDKIIAANTTITVGTLTFELLTAFTIPNGSQDAGPGSTSGLTGPTFVEGRSVTDNNVADSSDPNQTYLTNESSVIRGSIEVRVNGSLFQEVDALVFAGQIDAYSLDFDGDNRATIRFGDGISGNIPLVGSTIDISYRVGGGTQGNIAANTINTQLSATGVGGAIQVSATNPNPASGGADEESLESIKFNAPRFVKTVGNAVTKLDYDTLVSTFSDPTFGTIAKGVAFPRFGQTNSSANEVDIYVWARTAGGALIGSVAQGLKEALLVFMNERKVLTVDIFVNDGLLKAIDLDIIIYINQRIKAAADIVNDVNQAITDYFNRDSLEPAQTFYVSELYQVIMERAGVLQTIIGEPNTESTGNDTVLSSFVVGLTTDITATVGGLTPNEFAGGSITFTSGSLSGLGFPILRNTANVITIDAIVSTLVGGETFDLESLPVLVRDTPVADNEIYVLGTLELRAYERNQDTRQSILVSSL